MKKTSLLILMLFLMTACSQKELDVTPQVRNDVKKDINTTTTQETHTRIELQHQPVETTRRIQVPRNVSQEEFIPEHIRRSHIEVVTH